MVLSDVNKTYVRVNVDDRDIFYIKKADASKTFLKGEYISILSQNGGELYKARWDIIDVYDEETGQFTVENSNPNQTWTKEDTLIAVHNAFFFRDGVGIDLEQLANIEGTPGQGYILVYDSTNEVWTPTAVEFSTAANSLGSNVSGLSKSRLALSVIENADGQLVNQLVYTDAANTSYNVPLPTTVNDSGDVEAVTLTAVNKETDSVLYPSVPIGTPVHFIGDSTTETLNFVVARADDESTMPANGIVIDPSENGEVSRVALIGRIRNTTTGAHSIQPSSEEGTVLYVDEGGGLTDQPPSGSGVTTQAVAIIVKFENSRAIMNVAAISSGTGEGVPPLSSGSVIIGGPDGNEERQLNTDDILELQDTTKRFFEAILARQAISATSPIEYDEVSGVISFDDSGFLKQVQPADVLGVIEGGNGISIDGNGVIQVVTSGSDLIFDDSGNLTLANDIPTDTSELTNNAGFITLADLDEIETGSYTFPQDFTANMPTVNGVVKTFGKYKHNDPIPAFGKTVQELIIDAFTDFVDPVPSINIDFGPDYNHQYTSYSFRVDIDFGVKNQGSTATGEVYFKIDNGSYLLVESVSEGDNQYVGPVNIGQYSSSKDFYLQLRVTELDGSGNPVTATSTDDVRAQSRVTPTVNNKSVTRVATGGNTTNVSSTLREWGDTSTTYQADIQGNETFVPVIQYYFQYFVSGTTWTTLGGVTDVTSQDINGATRTFSTLTHDDISEPLKARVVVKSEEDGSEIIRNDTYGFDDVRFRFAYVICFSTTELTSSSSDADAQAVYDEFGGDDNGEKVRKIFSSGTYPGVIGSTPNPISNVVSGKHMYIIYPGSNEITEFLDGGVSPALGGMVNLGQFDIENQYGVTAEYTIYRTGAPGSIDNTFFTIG